MKRRLEEQVDETLEPHSKLFKLSLEYEQQIQSHSKCDEMLEANHDNSNGTIISLDDSISSEWLHLKYKCESYLLCLFSKKEFINLLVHRNKIFQDETLSRCLTRMNNFHCITPNQTNFEFLQTIHDPQIVLDYIKRMEILVGSRLEKNRHFLSNISSVLKGNIEFLKTMCSRGYGHIMEFVDDVMFENGNLMYEFMINPDNSNHVIYNRITNPNVANLLVKYGLKDFIAHLPPILLNDKQFWIDTSFKHTQYQELYPKLNDSIRYDKEIILIYPLYNCIFRQLPMELKQDKDIILKYIEWSGLSVCDELINNLSTELKFDRDIWLKCASKRYDYSKIPEQFRTDREFLLTIVERDIQSFIKLNIHDQDKEFMIRAVGLNPALFKELDTNFRNDRDFIIEILQHGRSYLDVKCLSEDMRDDKEIILLAIRIDVCSYNYASDRLRNDPEVYNSLWKYYDICKLDKVYNSLPKSVQRDTSLLIKYFKNSFYKEYFCLPILEKENKEFLMEVAKLDGSIYNYASDTMKYDRKFLLNCCENPNYYDQIKIDTNHWKNDKEVLLKVQHFDYSQVSSDLQNDVDISLRALKIDLSNISLIPESVKTNVEFVYGLFYQTYSHTLYASVIPEKVLRNKQAVSKLITHYTNYSIFLRYLNSDSEFMLSLMDVLKNYTIKYASPELKRDIDFVEKITIKYPEAIRDASTDLFNNKEFMSKIISVHPFLFENLSNELKAEKSFIVSLLDKNPQCVQYLKCDESNKEWIAEISLKYLDYFQQWLVFHIKTINFKGFRIVLIEHLRRKHSNRFVNHCNSILH